MKPSRVTFFLLSLGALLLAYIVLFEHRRDPASIPGASQPPLWPELDPSRVTSITISRTNGIIRAERKGDQWQLTDPAYPALPGPINQFLEGLAQVRRGTHVSAQELLEQPGQLVPFGLEPPQATIEIAQGDRRFAFRLGQRTPIGERVYIQQVGDGGLDIADARSLARLPVVAADWRNPALLNLGGATFDRFKVQAGGREFEVLRDFTNGVWRLNRPRSARADAGQVEQLLQRLFSAEVLQYVNDYPSADLEPYGLQPPDTLITFSQSTNPVITLELGSFPTNRPELVYARRSNQPGIVAAARSVREAVQLPYTALLDYLLATFPTETANRIAAKADQDFLLDRSTQGLWEVTQPLTFRADPALIQAFLNRLRSLRASTIAKEVVTELELPHYGLAPPRLQYSVKGRTGTNDPVETLLMQVDFGTNHQGNIYARRSDENTVYEVPADEVNLLPRLAFQLRDRRIWNFTTNQVASFTIEFHGEKRTVLRSPTGQWTFAPGSQGMVNTFALEETALRFGQLWARAWVAQGESQLADYGFPQLQHRLSVELRGAATTNTVRTIAFGATSPSGGPFAEVDLEGGPTVFEFPLELWLPYQEVLNSMGLLTRR